jgi:hypothetical protein
MTSRRSVSARPPQAAISSRVRPQPMHRPETGSMTQTSVQGVEGAFITYI